MHRLGASGSVVRRLVARSLLGLPARAPATLLRSAGRRRRRSERLAQLLLGFCQEHERVEHVDVTRERIAEALRDDVRRGVGVGGGTARDLLLDVAAPRR